jgi:hypothetical protein
MTSEVRSSSLCHQVAFAPWGETMRPLVVLNPYKDVPDYVREQWAAFPPDFELCCWIGGEITFVPSRNIIDYDQGVAEGYDQNPLARRSRRSAPRFNSFDRETQMVLEVMGNLVKAAWKERVQAVTRCCSLSYISGVYT